MLEFDGAPILLNSDIPQDDDVSEVLDIYRPKVKELEDNVVGYTKVHLDGRRKICRYRECNLGNLITDSMVYARIVEDLGGAYWTDAAVAFVQGGSTLKVLINAIGYIIIYLLYFKVFAVPWRNVLMVRYLP